MIRWQTRRRISVRPRRSGSSELARLVRGSARRLMSMRRPYRRSADNRVINRRSCPDRRPEGLAYLTGSFHNRAKMRQRGPDLRRTFEALVNEDPMRPRIPMLLPASRTVAAVFLIGAASAALALPADTDSLAAGGDHNCSVTGSTAFCWGAGGFGQVGDGTASGSRRTPVAVSGGTAFAMVSAGRFHSCALGGTGLASCWGNNQYGQVGDASTVRRTSPVAVVGGVSFAALTGGDDHTCGLDVNGIVYCWGRNNSGQLGDGTTVVSRPSPAPIAGGRTMVSTSAGGNHTCAIGNDRNAYCWGNNSAGNLGNNSTTSSRTPVQVVALAFPTSISAGFFHTCALSSGGTAYCWGNNASGELGDGTTTGRSRPVAVSGNLRFTSISAGAEFTCGIDAGQAGYCWGQNDVGQLGDGTTIASRQSPVPVAGGLTLASVSSGSSHACALTTGGSAYCWGHNGSGQVGMGTFVQGGRAPLLVTGGHTFTAVDAGSSHSCGVTSGGVAYCWGNNQSGQLGDGSTMRRAAPVAVSGLALASITAGTDHTCGLTTAGAAYCWGNNQAGALGNGSTTLSPTPVAVVGGLTFASLSAGSGQTCGSTTDGVEYCWGSNAGGKLGDGTTIATRPTPAPITNDFRFRAVSAGAAHSCGIARSGGIFCWGRNSSGQLGDYTTVDRRTPRIMPGATTYHDISAGAGHTCALATSSAVEPIWLGSAYCWGANNVGQLGTGTTTQATRPAAVVGDLTFTAVRTRRNHTCAIRHGNGGVYCWGQNEAGQLGDGSIDDSPTPVAVQGGVLFTAVGTGDRHTCGIATTRRVYCWGGNRTGQLGDGSTSASYLPVPTQLP